MNGLNQLKVIMFGPRGVGKTSLLATMYGEFSNLIKEANLQINPNQASKVLLDQRLEDMRNLADEFELRPSPGTTTTQRFTFEIGIRGQNPVMELVFIDIPGGYLSENKEYAMQLLSESDVVVVAIDTVAMTQSRGRWHDPRNQPRQITEIFQEAYKDIKNKNQRRLVIFAPVKCETIMREKDGGVKALLVNILDKYGGLFDCFAGLEDGKVAAVFTPVKTLGCFIFFDLNIENGEPVFCFHKTSLGAQYSPQYGDQPLRYILRFLLRMYLDKRPNRGLDWFVNLLTNNQPYREALEKLAQGCKDEEGFIVVQGKQLL